LVVTDLSLSIIIFLLAMERRHRMKVADFVFPRPNLVRTAGWLMERLVDVYFLRHA